MPHLFHQRQHQRKAGEAGGRRQHAKQLRRQPRVRARQLLPEDDDQNLWEHDRHASGSSEQDISTIGRGKCLHSEMMCASGRLSEELRQCCETEAALTS